ncbi:hypothetical protein, partial [Enterobacter intestinihominis]
GGRGRRGAPPDPRSRGLSGSPAPRLGFDQNAQDREVPSEAPGRQRERGQQTKIPKYKQLKSKKKKHKQKKKKNKKNNKQTKNKNYI